MVRSSEIALRRFFAPRLNLVSMYMMASLVSAASASSLSPNNTDRKPDSDSSLAVDEISCVGHVGKRSVCKCSASPNMTASSLEISIFLRFRYSWYRTQSIYFASFVSFSPIRSPPFARILPRAGEGNKDQKPKNPRPGRGRERG